MYWQAKNSRFNMLDCTLREPEPLKLLSTEISLMHLLKKLACLLMFYGDKKSGFESSLLLAHKI